MGTVAVEVSGLSAVEAEVVTASTITFCEGDMAIRCESCRGLARGGCRIGLPVVVVVGAFAQVVAPTVLGLGVAFCRGREASL